MRLIQYNFNLIYLISFSYFKVFTLFKISLHNEVYVKSHESEKKSTSVPCDECIWSRMAMKGMHVKLSHENCYYEHQHKIRPRNTSCMYHNTVAHA